jgi:type IV pilus assembly protein PilV
MSLTRKHSARARPLQANHGVGLIEVMVALFVLSVGLLGVAGLQTQGIRAGNTATFRNVAVFKANEIMELIRANSAGVVNYAVDFGAPGTDKGCDDYNGGTANECDSADMAAHDLRRWKDSLDAAFPKDGDARILVGAAAPWTVTVTITWSERGEDMTYISQATI